MKSSKILEIVASVHHNMELALWGCVGSLRDLFRRFYFLKTPGYFLPVGIRLDQTGIDCERFATDQALLDAPAQNRLEHPTKQIALTKAAILEKVEWSGTWPSSPSRQNHRYARLRCTSSQRPDT